MSVKKGEFEHPSGNGYTEMVWVGWSWPCLFFGCFWFLSKRLWFWAIISLVAAVCTGGLSWLVFPAFANSMHEKSLFQQGYKKSRVTIVRDMI